MSDYNNGQARFDGTVWELTLPFTAEGMTRLLRLQKLAGTNKFSTIVANGLAALLRYLTHIEPRGQLFAQLGNEFHRFMFEDVNDKPMFAKVAEKADRPGLFRIAPRAYDKLNALSNMVKRPDADTVMMALLLYEWYLWKRATGHIMRVGTLDLMEEPLGNL